MRWIPVFALCAFISLFFGIGCTDASHAERVLQQAGYTKIEMTGYRFLMCSEDDTTSTGFRAVSPSGHVVTGAVCGGLIFKGRTIRFD